MGFCFFVNLPLNFRFSQNNAIKMSYNWFKRVAGHLVVQLSWDTNMQVENSSCNICAPNVSILYFGVTVLCVLYLRSASFISVYMFLKKSMAHMFSFQKLKGLLAFCEGNFSHDKHFWLFLNKKSQNASTFTTDFFIDLIRSYFLIILHVKNFASL